MKLSKLAKTLIGVLTVLQLFSGLGIIIWLFSSFIPAIVQAGENPPPDLILSLIGEMLLWVIALTLYALALIIFYLVHAGTNKETSTGIKILWIILLLAFNGLAEVVYYFLEILPEKSLTSKL